MSVFLIDYENLGLEDLNEDDRVLIFYTNNSDNLTFSLMQRLNSAKARIEYVKVNCGGKNSLDFQLCSYLGYLIGTNSCSCFYIVSRDKGFSSVLNFWSERAAGANIVMFGPSIRSCADNNAEPEAAEVEQSQTVQPQIEQSKTEQPQTEQSQTDATLAEQPQTEQNAAPAEKPKRKYNRRAPYKRKPKAPAEQTA